MKPKTIEQILKDLYLSSMDNGEYDKEVLDTAVSEIQQLLEECAPEKQYKQDEAWRIAVNKTIDQYKSNIREKLR